jgi:hypothetical protein
VKTQGKVVHIEHLSALKTGEIATIELLSEINTGILFKSMKFRINFKRNALNLLKSLHVCVVKSVMKK